METKDTLVNRFSDVQARHAKRMKKIMELATTAKTHADFKMLALLVEEEMEKRYEDRGYILERSPSGSREKLVEVIAYEICDQTVAIFLKKSLDRLREVLDTPITPEPEDEVE